MKKKLLVNDSYQKYNTAFWGQSCAKFFIQKNVFWTFFCDTCGIVAGFLEDARLQAQLGLCEQLLRWKHR